MKQSKPVLMQTRRRFVALLAALGITLPGSVVADPGERLSKREAAFYRKGRKQ